MGRLVGIVFWALVFVVNVAILGTLLFAAFGYASVFLWVLDAISSTSNQ